MAIPTLSTIVWEKVIVAVAGLIIGQFANKCITSLVEDKNKKVQLWIKKKFHVLISKIPGLKNFVKTKEELNLNKNKNPEKLLENKISLKTNNFKNNQTLNNNSNSILENINEINYTTTQPSTSTKIYNSNSI